jgi:hypothetical protein
VWSLYSPDTAPHAQSVRGSFWWQDIFKLSNIYRSITVAKPITGDTILFWKDSWHTDTLLCEQFHRLFSFALDEDASVTNLVHIDLADLFALPLSVQAYEDYTNIQDFLPTLVADPSATDLRNFSWGNGTYTSVKFYNFMFEGPPNQPVMIHLWKSKCRVFAWLLIMDRLNTKDLMSRKHWHIEGGLSFDVS